MDGSDGGSKALCVAGKALDHRCRELDPMPSPLSEPSAASDLPSTTLQPSLASAHQIPIGITNLSELQTSGEVEAAPEADLTQDDLLLSLKVRRQVERAATPRGHHPLLQANPGLGPPASESVHFT